MAISRPGRVRSSAGAAQVPFPTGAVAPYRAVVFDRDAVLAGAPGRRRLAPGALDLARRLRVGGIPVALASGGAEPSPELEASLAAAFGRPRTAERRPGLPDQDKAALGQAVHRLGLPAHEVAAVLGATVHVEEARRMGFGLVVGITTGAVRAVLEAAGADLVLDDVGELDLGVLRTNPWLLVYEGFDPAHEGHREALTTLGNGYMGTRGAAPESRADGVHYPGTYLAGVYNRLTSQVHGRTVEDEHLVNAPNWLPLDLRIEDGGWWSQGGLAATQEGRGLDMRRGLLSRRVELVDSAGRRLQVTQRRLVSMQRPHLAALETVVVPKGWSGRLHVRSGIDAGVTNANVAEFAQLAHRHLGEVTAGEAGPDTLLVQAVTVNSRITIATAARTVLSGATESRPRRLESHRDGRVFHHLAVTVRQDEPVQIDKTIATATSRDRALAGPAQGALVELSRSPSGVSGLLPGHEAAWERLWRRFSIEVAAERGVQLTLNLHVFHLLQTLSTHTADVDAGVPARGLHGEGYRGHVFWDELFVLPVITAHLPTVGRTLLDYRWHRLDAARDAAVHAGLGGAMFPWQSGSDGREETPEQLFNLRSGRWMPDHSRRQRHVGLAVAYNAWQYYQATGDTRWLAERGADLIIEVTRFFAALATYDATEDRFHISGVMGPDEYHDGYPDRPGSGLRDNTYTNVLTAWVCQRALDTLAAIAGHDCDEVLARLAVSAEETTRWAHMARRLSVCLHSDGVISQFDGYERLAELEWEHYRATYGNIGRLDLILEAEGDSTSRYKLAKQADVLMLVYLLGPQRLLEVLAGLGYSVTPEALGRTIDFYLARVTHGSTLCKVVHASVLARVDPVRSWAVFIEALRADLDDTQGGTTREGIHLGAMAGTADMVARDFAGLYLDGNALTFTPRLPHDLSRVRFELGYRGQRIDVILDHDQLLLRAHPCSSVAPVDVRVMDARTTLAGGAEVKVRLRPTVRVVSGRNAR